jgi:hypothetical protein
MRLLARSAEVSASDLRCELARRKRWRSCAHHKSGGGTSFAEDALGSAQSWARKELTDRSISGRSFVLQQKSRFQLLSLPPLSAMLLAAAPLLGSSDTILVISPWLVICVALAVISVDLLLHYFAPWVRIRLTTTAEQRAALATHASRITALRIQSNKLNSPATFAEYAKTQRALQKELKAQSLLQAQIGAGGGQTMVHTAQQFALTYGLKIAVNVLCFLACVGKTLFVVPTSGWLSGLSYTPMRLVLGEVGVIPWLIVCATVSAALKAWL